MPHVIRPRGPLAVVASLISAAAMLFVALPAVAQGACPSTPTSEVFQSLADSALYSLAPGGSFETGAPGWSLTQTSVVSGNDSSYVHGRSDSHSLAIQPTGMAISPPICVSTEQPSFRFFARRTSGTWGDITVDMLWTDSTGHANSTTVASIGSGTTWTLTPVISLGQDLPLWQSAQTISVRIEFLPQAYGGAWAIDDLYIDPYKRS
jgi:hypothetical protein